jgi:hypothetical protein
MQADIHNESAIALYATPVHKVLVKRSRFTTQLKQPIHSPDVAPCDIYLFHKPNFK